MINTYFKLYLNNWQLFYVATDLVTLAFEVKLQSLFQFFLSLFGFLLMFLQCMISYFIFQQIYCLNILRMPFKIKRKKVKCLINARHCSAFYILLYNHLYTFTNFCYTFSNYIQFYVMIFYTYTYVYIHSISTLYWNLCSGLFLGIAQCDHL